MGESFDGKSSTLDSKHRECKERNERRVREDTHFIVTQAYTLPASQSMHLDPAIRDWVLFPIMVVMILVGVLRHLASSLLQSRPKTTIKGIRESYVASVELSGRVSHKRDRCALGRARLLRSPTAAYIPRLAFDARRLFLIQGFSDKKYLKVQDENEAVNPMDPAGMEAMTGMLKTNMMMLIPQTLIMSWITYFFSGFILSMFFIVCR
jgi:hypothetical protein